LFAQLSKPLTGSAYRCQEPAQYALREHGEITTAVSEMTERYIMRIGMNILSTQVVERQQCPGCSGSAAAFYTHLASCRIHHQDTAQRRNPYLSCLALHAEWSEISPGLYPAEQ
jgi:hypothetical protein